MNRKQQTTERRVPAVELSRLTNPPTATVAGDTATAGRSVWTTTERYVEVVAAVDEDEDAELLAAAADVEARDAAEMEARDAAEAADAWAAATSAEITNISDRLRRALECPICLLVSASLSCLCPNGHVVCHPCLVQMWNMHISSGRICPLCRAPMVRDVTATAVKLSEIITQLRVACSHRPFGCAELISVHNAAIHETVCSFMPDVQCHVSTCQWMGMYGCLFEHVSTTHPASAIKSPKNQLFLNNLDSLITNRRRSYLVHTPHGLFWVVMSVESRSRIRTTVLMVDNSTERPASHNQSQSLGPPGMVYRVSWANAEGKHKSRSRTRWVGWCASPKLDKCPESYTMIRCRPGRLNIVWYDRHPSHRHLVPDVLTYPSTSSQTTSQDEGTSQFQ